MFSENSYYVNKGIFLFQYNEHVHLKREPHLLQMYMLLTLLITPQAYKAKAWAPPPKPLLFLDTKEMPIPYDMK